MTLPLPYVVHDPEVQGNFDEISLRWPTAARATGSFSAYRTSGQSLTASVAQRIDYDAEEWDLSGWFDAAGNHRFVPLLAGYYRLSAAVTNNTAVAAGTRFILELRKNGTLFKYLSIERVGGGVNDVIAGTALVVANGSTDYFEIFITCSSAVTTTGGATVTYFQGEYIGGL